MICNKVVINIKNKSFFSQIILIVIIAVICLIVTIGFALLLGSIDTTVFDFKNLNFANMIPVLIIGGIISCIVVGIAIMFLSKNVFASVKNYFEEENKKENK